MPIRGWCAQGFAAIGGLADWEPQTSNRRNSKARWWAPPEIAGAVGAPATIEGTLTQLAPGFDVLI